jgi:hypothetical protein
MGASLCVGRATRFGLDGPGNESRWRARFSAPVQTGPVAHLVPCKKGIGTLLIEKIVSPLRTTITLNQRWQTYGTRKDFLGTRHSLLSQFLFVSPDNRLCIVKDIAANYVHCC